MSHSAEPDQQLPSHSDDQPAPAPQRMVSRWFILVPTVIAVVALGVAAWALLRPTPEAHSSPTTQQVTDATGRACAEYSTVRTAVALQTHGDPGTDRAAAQAVRANARLAMAVGSQHLIDDLSPAVPAELAGLLRSLASNLQDLTINALAGAADDDPSQVARLHDLQTNSVKIVDLCK